MNLVSNITTCITIFNLPAGVGMIWLGVRMIRGKSLQYIVGNANGVFDGADDEAHQRSLGMAAGAALVALGVIVLACIPLGFLFG